MKNALQLLALVLSLSACSSVQSGEGHAFNEPGRTDDRPFSHGYVAGDTVYLSGTLGLDPETRAVPDSVEAEVRNAMDTIGRRLDVLGLGFEDVVSVKVYCSDVSLYGEFNEVYATYFDGNYPARAFVGSGPLLFEARFEICATARL